jgi:hypothetical protein
MNKVELLNSDTQRPIRSRAVRRENGIYYSPPDVVTALVNWAVRAADDTIFDPSFGGCVFLRAGVTRLMQLGAVNAPGLVFGTDWDQDAWGDAIQLIHLGANPKQFQQKDFLSVRPEDVGGPFRVVVGNPPYVRAHVLSGEALSTARASLLNHFRLSKRASYWAYFVLHALSFVAPGGRMALILPGTFLRADYADAVRSELIRAFASVTILVLDEHLFADADEKSVLVLAEQYGCGPGTVRIGNAKRDGLLLHDAINTRTRLLTINEEQMNWVYGLFEPETLALYDELSSRFGTLGNTARIRIGVVTGRNDYFLVNADTREKMKIEDIALRPVIAKTAELRSLWLNPSDADASLTRLFIPPATDLPPGAARYIKHGEEIGVQKGFKCAQRTPWYIPQDVEPPDAFLSCMVWTGARLVNNLTDAVCTNTLLSVSFQPELDHGWRTAYAAGALSTVAQLSSELEGRASGGGLLKLEPSDAGRLVVPPVSLSVNDQACLDALCRAGRWGDARLLVDERIPGELLTHKELDVLKMALDRARTRRLGYHNSLPK